MGNLKSAATGAAGGAMRFRASPWCQLVLATGFRTISPVTGAIGGDGDGSHAAVLGVVGAVDLVRRGGQGEELSDVDGFDVIVPGAGVGDGDAAGFEADVGDGSW